MRTKLITGAVLAGALAVSGCGGNDAVKAKPSGQPVAVTTPGVRTDGSYQLGTLPSADAAAALKAATTALPAALSYDYRSLSKSLATATALMTPGFAKKFSTTFNATTVAMATAKQAITTSLVRAAGVVSPIQADKVLCVIYLDQVLVASKDKKPSDPLKVSQNSVHVTMRMIDGKWKVDDIEPF